MLFDLSLLNNAPVIPILYKLSMLYKLIVTVRVCGELLSDTVPYAANVLWASQHLAGVAFPLSRDTNTLSKGTNAAACVSSSHNFPSGRHRVAISLEPLHRQ